MALHQDDAEHGSSSEPDERQPLLTKEHTYTESEHYIGPIENVYSYHMFIVPVERQRACFTTTIAFACFLVVINLMMQFWLLTMVSQFVIDRNKDLINSVVKRDYVPWYRSYEWVNRHAPWADPAPEACRDSSSLCFDDGDGNLTCAPPSIQVLEQWHLLDTNGDGFWSRSEAAREDLRKDTLCKYNVDTLILFDDIVDDVRKQKMLQGRVHPDYIGDDVIHKAYFDWFIGEPMLCQYGDQDMCGTLFERGVFDGALAIGNKYPNTERGINSVQSARDYCARLLTHRCESLLPSTYRVWKVSSVEKCGKKHFEPFQYSTPGEYSSPGSSKQWMLRVGFSQEDDFKNASSWQFVCYLSVLMFVFFAVMFEEFKQIWLGFLWVFQSGKINGAQVEMFHIVSVFMINLFRSLLFVVLLYSGIVFLSEDINLLGLIFDALSLVFIINIDEILYCNLLRMQMKGEHQECAQIDLPMKTPFSKSFHVMHWECIRVLLLTLCAILICYRHWADTVKPLKTALQCLCTVQGERCYEATTYGAAWWDRYWTVTLPEATEEINRLTALLKQDQDLAK